MNYITIYNTLISAGLLATLAGSATAAETTTASASPWKWTASWSVKEAYDSNVYLQSVTGLAEQASLITTAILSVSGSYKPSETFGASLDYAPEAHFFHAESSEDFVLHRTGLKLGGQSGSASWEIANSLIVIDGDDEGLIFTGPGGAPAAGGPALRDRRDSLVERAQAKLTYTLEQWFLRPVGSVYAHDFQTVHKTTPGYLNYVDRSDWNAGLDVGYDLGHGTWAVVGYRYGAQEQDPLFAATNPTHYDCTYHRALFGIEGKPTAWVKFAGHLGPEFRTYSGSLPAAFDQVDETYLYTDLVVTLTPTKADTVTLSAKSFQQPGFGGRGTYLDSTFDLTWRHKLADQVTIGAGARAYNTDFLEPVLRNDWIYTGSLMAAYTFNPSWSGEISYLYDRAESEIPLTEGREYTRHYLALSLKYLFH